MKKTNKIWLVAAILALVMMVSIFAGCAKKAEMPEEFGGKTKTTQTTEAVKPEAKAETKEEAKTETKEEAKAETKEEVKVEAKEERKGYFVPFVEVVDDVVYCDVDYFLSRATVTFTDGTAALRATTEGTEVVLDDMHAITERGNHREKTGLPLPINGGNVAVTLDGEKATSVALHTHAKKWALCYAEDLETGYELRNAKRDGVEAEWLQITAVCVENADAEFGYDFYVVINMECVPEVVAPVYNPQPKPEQPKEEPKEETEVEEPEEKPEPERPGGGGHKPKPEEPENNPPIEDDPETPDEPVVPGEPENNPPIEDTPFPEGPQPPADMNPENSGPADMQDSTSGPADLGSSDSAVNADNSESSAPADMGGSSSNTSSSNRSNVGSSYSGSSSSASDSSGPADMA